MKKLIFILLLSLLISPIISAELEVKELEKKDVIIYEIKNPAELTLEIKNLGTETKLMFYNLLGFPMSANEKVSLKKGETKEIKLTIHTRDDLKVRGNYVLEYFIKTEDENKTSRKIVLEIIDLKDAFEISTGEIDPESNSLQVYFQNLKNYEFEQIDTKISSPFFELERKFSLNPYEKKTFEIILNQEDFKKLIAGYYTLEAEIKYLNVETKLEGKIRFVEKDIVKTEDKEYGLFINTKTITKENKGNLVSESQTIITKNIISRLFTTFSPEPDSVQRDGLIVTYTWNQEIKPGEKQNIIVKTNWFFPFIIILLIIVVVIFAKKYSEEELEIEKRVNFVRTKGGEFALRVTVGIKAKAELERITLRDRIPVSMKIHKSFTGEQPSRVDEKSRILEWDFNYLQPGEKRYLSYTIYSKLGVLGKFALPRATAVFEKNGKIKESASNRAFFIAEQRTKDVEEYE